MSFRFHLDFFFNIEMFVLNFKINFLLFSVPFFQFSGHFRAKSRLGAIGRITFLLAEILKSNVEMAGYFVRYIESPPYRGSTVKYKKITYMYSFAEKCSLMH